jgi:hypothetical protein
MELNRQALIDTMEPTFEGHTYVMDAKPPLASSPGYWKAADCSGFVRWLLFGAFRLTVPDGSVNIHEWCEQKALPVCKYSEVGPLEDSILRICFIEPKDGEAGHVFLLVNENTIESYGGHGPGRRPWDTPILLKNVSACYELGNLV